MIKHLVVVSDLHINSTVGLCGETVKLDDGGTYTSSKSQKWLHKNWLQFWYGEIQNLEGDVTTVINGDLVDLTTKYSTHQHITTNASIVLENALGLLQPVLQTSKKIYVVRGTAAHVGPSAELENILAREIGAVPNERSNSWWSLNLDVSGVLFDIAHHGRVGSKPWNRSSPLNSLAAEIAFESMKNSTAMPNVVVRSHNHTHADTHDNLPVRVISTPAWQLSTEFSYRLGLVNLADIGGLIFSCEDGQYKLSKLFYKPAAKQVEIV